MILMKVRLEAIDTADGEENELSTPWLGIDPRDQQALEEKLKGALSKMLDNALLAAEQEEADEG